MIRFIDEYRVRFSVEFICKTQNVGSSPLVATEQRKHERRRRGVCRMRCSFLNWEGLRGQLQRLRGPQDVEGYAARRLEHRS